MQGRMLVAGLVALAALTAQAEVIEEIVAKVNDDIITKTELEAEEQALVADLFQRFSGEELDRQMEAARGRLLQSLIDRRILVHKAELMFTNKEEVQRILLDRFIQEQQIPSKEELERVLAQDGLELDDLVKRLFEMAAPQEVINFEVSSRVSVRDADVEEYYRGHPDEFAIDASVNLREIVFPVTDDAQRGELTAQMEAIRTEAQAAEADFAELARRHSQTASAENGGLIGPFTPGDLAPALESVAFRLEAGTVSEVIDTGRALHLIQVEQRTQASKLPLEEVRDEIRARLEDEMYSRELQAFLQKIREESSIWISPKYAKNPTQGPGQTANNP